MKYKENIFRMHIVRNVPRIQWSNYQHFYFVGEILMGELKSFENLTCTQFCFPNFICSLQLSGSSNRFSFSLASYFKGQKYSDLGQLDAFANEKQIRSHTYKVEIESASTFIIVKRSVWKKCWSWSNSVDLRSKCRCGWRLHIRNMNFLR